MFKLMPPVVRCGTAFECSNNGGYAVCSCRDSSCSAHGECSCADGECSCECDADRAGEFCEYRADEKCAGRQVDDVCLFEQRERPPLYFPRTEEFWGTCELNRYTRSLTCRQTRATRNREAGEFPLNKVFDTCLGEADETACQRWSEKVGLGQRVEEGFCRSEECVPRHECDAAGLNGACSVDKCTRSTGICISLGCSSCYERTAVAGVCEMADKYWVCRELEPCENKQAGSDCIAFERTDSFFSPSVILEERRGTCSADGECVWEIASTTTTTTPAPTSTTQQQLPMTSTGDSGSCALPCAGRSDGDRCELDAGAGVIHVGTCAFTSPTPQRGPQLFCSLLETSVSSFCIA